MMNEKFKIILNGKTAVFVDWANVYGWKKSLKKEVDPKKLYKYLKSYKEIKLIHFYFGTDNNIKSINFLKIIDKIGFTIITKPVKYITIAIINNQKVFRRKCDFDMEISIDVHRVIKDDYRSFIFLSGDGDFEPLYKLLIQLNKQVIVIYAHGHLGKEIWDIKKGIYKKAIDRLDVDLFFKKNAPQHVSQGRD
jgi:uncharacterized LabA/DUF88 family protein